jgi:hypothetical protein
MVKCTERFAGDILKLGQYAVNVRKRKKNPDTRNEEDRREEDKT